MIRVVFFMSKNNKHQLKIRIIIGNLHTKQLRSK